MSMAARAPSFTTSWQKQLSEPLDCPNKGCAEKIYAGPFLHSPKFIPAKKTQRGFCCKKRTPKKKPKKPVLNDRPEGQPAASGHSKAQGRGKRPVASSACAAVDLAIGPAHALHHKQPRSVLRPNPNKRPAIEDGSSMTANLLIDQFGSERPDAVITSSPMSPTSSSSATPLTSSSSAAAPNLWFGGDHSEDL